MDFLVIANNSVEDNWKVELLIQSCKMHGLEDQLVVGIKHQGSSNRSQLFSTNFLAHKRKFSFKETESNPLFYGMFLAVENNLIDQDRFTVLPKTSILLNPVPIRIEDVSQVIVSSELRKHNSDLRSQFEAKNQWIPFHSTAVFNRVPKSFFAHLAQRSKYFNFPADCFNLTCVAYSKFLKFRVENLESSLVQNSETFLLNYKDGLPPVLHLKEIDEDMKYWEKEHMIFESLVKNKPTINAAVLLKTELAYRQLLKNN